MAKLNQKKEIPKVSTQQYRLNLIQKQKHGLTKNEWFGKDSAMTYTAFDLHKKLVNEEGLILNRRIL